ncbi:acetyltransferase [Pontibacterium granulatum]|uniref:acetyltransferase n=1 Tax=Pontibacterium granulatum TaxID=2036029 RepID=UPI00249C3E7F|nr:acetyltransferase [Pontibacterium granulatum]MDI3323033.1 acetyltransferase [Pontibacterium granulatum]
MKRLAILGASGHGKVVADAAQLLGWDVFFFDDGKHAGEGVGSWKVLGSTDDLIKRLLEFDGVIVGIGKNEIRISKSRQISEAGGRLVSIIHPGSNVSPYADINVGTVVMAGAVVNAFTTIGTASIVNSGATIDHDCNVADGVHISPGANVAGGVNIGRGSWIGIGSSVKELVTIGSDVVVGAGAVVLSDVASSNTVYGVPAK